MVSKLNSQLIKGIAGSLILFSALPYSVESFAKETGYPRVGMNFRASPNGKDIGGIPKGENLTILSRKNGWLKVKRRNGRVGWVWAKYITVNSTTKNIPKPTARPAATTTAANSTTSAEPNEVTTHGELINVRTSLNIRKSPSSSSRRMGALRPGQDFEIIGEASNGWYKVRTSDGVIGYASDNYIQSKAVTQESQETVITAYAPADGNTASAAIDALDKLASGEQAEAIDKEKTDAIEPASTLDRAPTAVIGELVGVENYLNVRKDTSTRSSEVARLRPNDFFQILGQSENGWYKVRTSDGTEGFVSDRYVKPVEPKPVVRPEHALDQIAELNQRKAEEAEQAKLAAAEAEIEAECKENGCLRKFTNSNGEVREVHQLSDKLLDFIKENPPVPPRTTIVDGGCRFTSSYGNRRHPILGYTRMHTGVDIAPPTPGQRGIMLRAPFSGKVVKRGWSGGYGNVLHIQLDNGYTLSFNHLAKKSKLNVGQRVSPGTIIGEMGSTGLSTGVHLHLEVLNGRGHKVNPLSVIKKSDLCTNL